MTSRKPAANLLKRLERMTLSKSDDLSQDKSRSTCTLSYQRPCCQGQGFTLENSGMFAHAKVCPCVDKCPSCRGRMLLVEDGAARPCKKPSPKYIAHLFNDAKIPSRYTFSELDDFANHTGNGPNIVAKIREWERGYYQSPDKGLVLHGAVGVGKTFILAALARNLLFKGVSVKFVDFFQLITQIKASFALKSPESQIIEPLMDVDVLVIDELGKGRNSEFEVTILDQIIMGRYNQNKILIASTNYPFEEDEKVKRRHNRYQTPLDSPDMGRHKREGVFSEDVFSPLSQRMDQRIMSRLKESTQFLSLTGADYRELKGK